MRKFFSEVGFIIVFAVTMTAPLMAEYVTHGGKKNGYTIYRYPNETRVVSQRNSPLMSRREIIDSNNDDLPDVATVGIPIPKLGGYFYQHSRLTPDDCREWELAMK